MKNKNRFAILPIIFFFSLLLALTSCDDTINIQRYGSYCLELDGSSSKTVQPVAEKLVFTSYRLIGKKGSSDIITVDETFTDKTIKVDNLETGSWSFYVEGYNSDGTLIGQSVVHNVTIQTDTVTRETYALERINGIGVLTLSISVQTSRVNSIICSLRKDDSETQVLTLTKEDAITGQDGMLTFCKSFCVDTGMYDATITMKDKNDQDLGFPLHPSVHIYSQLESPYVFSWENLKAVLPGVDNPVASIASGEYLVDTKVSFSTEEAGTTIWYSTGGEYVQYTEPISLSNASTTFTVYATKENMKQSQIIEYFYSCVPVLSPVISLASGMFSSGETKTVTISCDDLRASIYYTTDGSNPISSQTRLEYNSNNPIVVTKNTTLKAIAIVSENLMSETVERTYSFIVPTPSVSLSAGSYTTADAKTITINCADSNATVRYTLDGTDPTSSDTAVTFKSSKIIPIGNYTLKIVAESDGCKSSDVVSNSYAFTVPTPAVSLDPGSYSTADVKTITLSCSDPDAIVYYTLDGSEPAISNTAETFNFYKTIQAGSFTLKMIAKVDYLESSFFSGIYVFDIPEVEISLDSGQFSSAETKEVTISCADPEATVFYTLDGTDPHNSVTTNSFNSSITLELNKDSSLRAMASKDGFSSTATISRDYIFKVPDPIVIIQRYELTNDNASAWITLECNDPFAYIYYTFDGLSVTSLSHSVFDGQEIRIEIGHRINVIAYKNGCSRSSETSSFISLYGAKGPAGGYVFYDCDADNDNGNSDGLKSSECGWRYLEAAPSDLRVVNGVPTVNSSQEGYPSAPENYLFGYCRSSSTDNNIMVGTGNGVGYGLSNTIALVNAMGSTAYCDSSGTTKTGEYAANLCSILEYTFDGVTYDDWFLPSKYELNEMYEHLSENGLGGFDASAYWSSTEYKADSVYYQEFLYLGRKFYEARSSYYRVRPVRAF